MLSYNVHGFYWRDGTISSEERSSEIGRLLGPYDVVMVQEDFEYHDLLTHAFAYQIDEVGNPPRDHFGLTLFRVLTAPIRLLSARAKYPYGSGLSIFSKNLVAPEGEVTREWLGACYGWLRHANDCLASKGFLRVRVRLPGGAEVDVYNTHLDAGSTEGDRAARLIQLEGLQDRIRTLSGGRAVILGGDLNSDYDDEDGNATRGPDYARVERLMRETRLQDSGARPPASRWRRIDYILYRGSDRVQLAVTDRGEDLRFVHDGSPLSDHPAIFAEFEVTMTLSPSPDPSERSRNEQ